MEIKASNLSFSYKKKEIYDNLSLVINKPQNYLILGKNGTGKTTLLKLISGLLKPNSGNVLINEVEAFPRKAENLENLFFVPEEFELPNASLADYYKPLSNFYKNFSEEDFKRYLDEFDLDINMNFQSSSFGQKKKSIIAFAIATNTPILIFDEPTNGLDVSSKNSFRAILNRIKDRTVLITGHNVRDLNEVIDHIIIVESKEVLFSNSIDFINKNYKIENVTALKGNELYYEGNSKGFKAIYPIKNEANNETVDLEFFYIYTIDKLKRK